MAPTVWYHVRNLDEGRRFYQDILGFEELAVDFDARWSELRRGEMEIGLAEGEPTDEGVAHVDVTDLKDEADRLRGRRRQVPCSSPSRFRVEGNQRSATIVTVPSSRRSSRKPCCS